VASYTGYKNEKKTYLAILLTTASAHQHKI